MADGERRGGNGGDGHDEALARALVENIIKAFVEWARTPSSSEARPKKVAPHQYSLWKEAREGSAPAPSSLTQRGEAWRRAVLRHRLANDFARIARAGIPTTGISPTVHGAPTSSPRRVRLNCDICGAFLGMSDYTLDLDGVPTVTVRSACAACLEEGLRVAARETGVANSDAPVIRGGAEGDGQPRGHLLAVRAVAVKKKG